jgi:[CysO sulfur-carrier protein]-S-L-cysteine hydrolase
VRISRAHWDELIAHAREDAPNECCGYVTIADGVIDGINRGVNERHSPYGYVLDSKSRFDVWKLEEDGAQVGAYHSHPRSPAEPSQTDINLEGEPGWLHLIVSLTHEPAVRAWWIRDGKVEEEELDVIDG